MAGQRILIPLTVVRIHSSEPLASHDVRPSDSAVLDPRPTAVQQNPVGRASDERPSDVDAALSTALAALAAAVALAAADDDVADVDALSELHKSIATLAKNRRARRRDHRERDARKVVTIDGHRGGRVGGDMATKRARHERLMTTKPRRQCEHGSDEVHAVIGPSNAVRPRRQSADCGPKANNNLGEWPTSALP